MRPPRRVAPRRRRVTPVALAAGLALAGLSCARPFLEGAPGVGASFGAARACPPGPPFANPGAAAYDVVAAYVRAQAVAMRGLEPVQGEETRLTQRGKPTDTRARAVPAPCAHLDSAWFSLPLAVPPP